MAITSPGVGSNLDVNGIINQLMAIEQQPLVKLATKEASYQAKLSAVGSIKGALSTLQSSISALTRASTFAGSYKASSTDSTIASASATSTASKGSYSIAVQQLAKEQKLRTSATYTGSKAVMGSGKITIQFGTSTPAPTDSAPSTTFAANPDKAATTINIDPAKNTLLDVRDAINTANAGVTASIVNDGSGYRLSISANDTGTANSLKISVEDADGDNTDAAGLSALAFDPTTTRNMKISQAAADALFSIDGIPIVKSSNTVADAIEGVSLSLVKEGSANISVSFDRSGISAAVQGFVKVYNETNKQLREVSSYNAETKAAGALQGDALVRTIQSQLRAALRGDLSHGGGGLSNLAEIGISFARDGSMTLDSSKLNAAVNDPAKNIGSLFAEIAKATDPDISVLRTTAGRPAGSYRVEISRLATQGQSLSLVDSKTVTAGVNDSFTVAVDGVSATVTLAAGTYTLNALAGEIQSKLNGSSALKTGSASVSVKGSLVSELTSTGAVDLNSLAAGSFSLTIGATTKTISVNAGTSYADHDQLVADLQAKIDAAFSGQSFTVKVSHASGALTLSADGVAVAPSVSGGVSGSLFSAPTTLDGEERLTITSSKFGSESKISALSSALLSGTSIVNGVDVAGKIAGVSALGTGQELKAEGPASGITLKITGGPTGDRGSVSYERGFAKRLDEMLTTLLSSKGSVSGKTEGLKSSIEDLDDRREVLGRRLTQIEARYRKQFTALDTLMSQMTQTSSYLAQQLSRLPGASSS
jgi:flagellar hook-associated protein 2